MASTEEKLQEELHVEQAVQDIVRLIKQDARTALLIVQLLRRYQLERSHVCFIILLFFFYASLLYVSRVEVNNGIIISLLSTTPFVF